MKINVCAALVVLVFGGFIVGAWALARNADNKQAGTEEERQRLVEVKTYGQL